MLILGLNKTTLLDYPGCVAATIFTGGCNFRCPFCHNRGLVVNPPTGQAVSEEEIFTFLQKRKNVLKGVCITGGEPTLQGDLPEFIVKVRKMGYRVKLDTNGYKPEILKGLMEEGLLDYVAMDIKNCPDKYEMTIGIGESFDFHKVEESVDLLLSGKVEYEFRTTVVRELHLPEDIAGIGQWIKGCRAYYLQKFQDNGNNICSGYHEWDREAMDEMRVRVSCLPGMEGNVYLRGC